MKIIIRNMGSFCGNDNWYMFYCPNCERSIDMNLPKKERMACKYCGQELEYDKNGE